MQLNSHKGKLRIRRLSQWGKNICHYCYKPIEKKEEIWVNVKTFKGRDFDFPYHENCKKEISLVINS